MSSASSVLEPAPLPPLAVPESVETRDRAVATGVLDPQDVAGTRPRANAVGNVQRVPEPLGVPIVGGPGVDRTRLAIIREGSSPG
jgi:hypothetical protein